MKLLFDQNLSPRLIKSLSDLYPHAVHVQSLGLATASDEQVWQYARMHGHVIVTKDVDFSERGILQGFPPKIIWIRRGNCTTNDIEHMLRNKFIQIAAFNGSKDTGVLVLT